MNVIRWLKHPWVVVGLLVLAAVGAFFGWGWYQQSLAEQHLQRARQAIVNQNLPLAKEELLTSLSYRESKTAHLLLARALWQIGLPSEAESHLQKARPEAGT